MQVHVQPVSTYLKTFGLLLVLLVVTVLVSRVNLWGFFNTVVAMTVAIVKAGFVVSYFMHLKGSSKLTQVWAGAGLIFLVTLFILSMSDYYSRR